MNSELILETVNFGIFEGCFTHVGFYGTREECIAEYEAKYKGKRAEIRAYNPETGCYETEYLPLETEEWRNVWVAPESKRGTKRAFRVEYFVLGEPEKDDDGFEWDPIPDTFSTIRADSPEAALRIAEELYPGSAEGYKITAEITNKAPAIND